MNVCALPTFSFSCSVGSQPRESCYSWWTDLQITLTSIPRGPSSGESIFSRLTIDINCYKNLPYKSVSSLKEAARNHRLLKTGLHETSAILAPKVFDHRLPSPPELRENHPSTFWIEGAVFKAPTVIGWGGDLQLQMLSWCVSISWEIDFPIGKLWLLPAFYAALHLGKDMLSTQLCSSCLRTLKNGRKLYILSGGFHTFQVLWCPSLCKAELPLSLDYPLAHGDSPLINRWQKCCSVAL